MTKKASCSECPNSFELIPPADKDYSVPKEKTSSDDVIKRVYECDEEHHRNTIYWHKPEARRLFTKTGGYSNNP